MNYSKYLKQLNEGYKLKTKKLVKESKTLKENFGVLIKNNII